VLIKQNNLSRNGRGMDKVVEQLSSKSKTLSTTERKKRQERRKEGRKRL
jgi:hypothetical protein